MKVARESSEKRAIEPVESSEWFAKDGVPMARITCAASELIPTRQYANVIVGPITVTRFVVDGDDDHLRVEINRTQSLCEEAVAEERKTLQGLLRQRVEATAA